MDSITGRYFDPEAAPYMEPIGLEHFFDAFGLAAKREFRGAAAEALGIPLEDIQPNLAVEQSSAKRFHPTPICVPEAPPAKRVKRSKENDNLTRAMSRLSRIVLMSRIAIAPPPTRTSVVRMDHPKNLIWTGSWHKGWMTLSLIGVKPVSLVMTCQVSPLMEDSAHYRHLPMYWNDCLRVIAWRSLPRIPTLTSMLHPSSSLQRISYFSLPFTWLKEFRRSSARCWIIPPRFCVLRHL